MHTIKSPIGTDISIPERIEENGRTFSLDELSHACRYYEDNGYVVVRNVVDSSICDMLRTAFADTVKRYSGHIYRQATANPEKNKINEYGFVMNPILNLQSLRLSDFSPLKRLAVKTFASHAIKAINQAIFSEDVKLVQSMY